MNRPGIIINGQFSMSETISYVVGGMFGDFIQSLSVIAETFYKTGKKGVVYLSEKGDTFRNGIESTYKDTYNMIMKQEYIQEYKIYHGEPVDIDLSLWRKNPHLYFQRNYVYNWYNIYKDTYRVEWGKHKWLNVPRDEKWENAVVINTTNYRFPCNIDFNALNRLYPDRLVFVSSDINQYHHFISKTSVQIPFCHCSTFDDLCIAINSCSLFVGSLSAPLTIAHACHTDRIIGFSNLVIDDQLNMGFDTIWKNVRYTVS